MYISFLDVGTHSGRGYKNALAVGLTTTALAGRSDYERTYNRITWSPYGNGLWASPFGRGRAFRVAGQSAAGKLSAAEN